MTTSRGAVGYQVFGSGDRDLVYISHWLTNIDMYWDEPSAIRFFDRLASMGRVILIDKLASGVSDMPQGGLVPPVEEHMDDVRAVLAEVGSSSAILVGDAEGGMLAMMLAATYPDQFPRLILINSYPRLKRAEDYPIGAPSSAIETMKKAWLVQHGTSGDVLYLTAPSAADDVRFRAWFVRFQRASQKPRAAAHAVEWIARTDVRAALPSIQADTLVIHRRDAQFHRLAFGRYLADNIAGARLEIVEGADTLPFHAGNFDPTLDLVEEFVTGKSQVHESNRMLATVMFTDIVESTARASAMGDEKWLDLLEDHDRVVRRNLERFRGEEVKMTGDGALATFDGPQRAILCAIAIKRDLARIGLSIRAGLHTGEIERRDGELGGLAVHIASRVMEIAESGGIVVSGTVKDLVVGSPMEFTACGVFDLKGVPGSWGLFEVQPPQEVLRP
jgi:class 3 adenylate cyclase/pimeloyl-ACP methyl ester carboxylesterase